MEKTLKEKLYSNLQTMTLEDYDKYLKEEENKYITIKSHPEDENIVILNYTELTAFERRWNKETMSARGLILDLTDVKNNGIIYILAKPFEKFFNYGENLDYEKDINFTQVESVMEKMDGSLGISYFFNNEIRFATRGSFESEQAIKATEIWREKYASNHDIELDSSVPVTYLVEIIYPENRVVVNYNNEEKLVLLGITSKNCDFPYSSLIDEAYHLKMSIASQYEFTLEQMLEMKKSISANEEGWIIRFKNGKRLKIKGDEYLQVHRIKHGMSDKAKFKAWSEDKLEEYIMMLPEEFRPELEAFAENLDTLKDLKYYALQSVFEYIKQRYPEKKDFAIHTNSFVGENSRKFMFDAYKNGSISVRMIKEDIYKNYRENLEVIDLWKNLDS